MPDNKLSTKNFAQLNKCAPGTVRRHHSDWGHYYGVAPTKSDNGDLEWPPVIPDISKCGCDRGHNKLVEIGVDGDDGGSSMTQKSTAKRRGPAKEGL